MMKTYNNKTTVMKTYYIYHVPGVKNGATNQWDKRSNENIQKYGIEPIIVETMEGPDTPEFWQIVGDREWELADLNGYSRGEHYRSAREKRMKGSYAAGEVHRISGHTATMGTYEGRSKGGIISGNKNVESGHLKRIGSIMTEKKRLSNIQNARSNSRLTLEIAQTIRRRLANGELGYKLAEEYNVTNSTISLIKNNKQWNE